MPLAEGETRVVATPAPAAPRRPPPARGREILGGWAQNVNHFAKVMPRDYKRVLLAIEQAEKDGRNVDEAIMEAANG